MSKKLWRVDKEEVEYVRQAVDGGLKGEFNKRLEQEWSDKFGVQYAIGVNSGTSALHCALFACGVERGDEVIVPPLTFIAPAFAASQLGAIPVFADVDPDTFNIDPQDIEKRITPKTKAIVAVSLYGLPADMDPIMALAKKHNLKVVEDNAECIFGKYKGRIAGTIGDMSIFTFERSKHLTTGIGGMITTNDEQLAERARKFSILGYTTLSARQDSFKGDLDRVQHPSFKRHEFIGFNYRLPEVCAAMAVAQLEKLDMLVKLRQDIAKLYEKAIQGCKWLKAQKTPAGYENSFWTFVMKLDTNQVSWEDFRKAFVELGGERYYGAWSINYLEPAYAGPDSPTHRPEYKIGLCPIAEELHPRLIQLKTNFGDLDYAQKQADLLAQTIKKLSRG